MTQGKRQSLKQEKRITKSLGEIMEARRQMASGALWFAKSDVVTELLQIEAKTKEKPSKSISLKKEWFKKVEEEGFLAGKIPCLAFSFGDNSDYYAVKDNEFLAILEELIELRRRVAEYSEVLTELYKHGIGDLNPTLTVNLFDGPQVITFYMNYVKSLDNYVRKKAQKALTGR